jgi:hypothetical protein
MCQDLSSNQLTKENRKLIFVHYLGQKLPKPMHSLYPVGKADEQPQNKIRSPKDSKEGDRFILLGRDGTRGRLPRPRRSLLGRRRSSRAGREVVEVERVFWER